MRKIAAMLSLLSFLAPSVAFTQRSRIDFDGDGLADRYSFQGASIIVVLGTGAMGRTALSRDYNTSNGTWREGDFNGDGKTDLAHIVFNGVDDPNYVHVHVSAGNGQFVSPTYFNFRLAANPQHDYKTSDGYWSAEDYNRDGRTDLVHDTGRARIHHWRSLGNGQFEIQTWPEPIAVTPPPPTATATQQRPQIPTWAADCLCKRGSSWAGNFFRNPIGAPPSVGGIVVLSSNGQVCYPKACDDGISVTSGSKKVKVSRVFIASQGSQVYTFSIFGEEVP